MSLYIVENIFWSVGESGGVILESKLVSCIPSNVKSCGFLRINVLNSFLNNFGNSGYWFNNVNTSFIEFPYLFKFSLSVVETIFSITCIITLLDNVCPCLCVVELPPVSTDVCSCNLNWGLYLDNCRLEYGLLKLCLLPPFFFLLNFL